MALLRVNKVREFSRVSQEEDRGVVGNHVPVALIGSKLHSEPSRIARTVVRTRLASDGGEANGDGTALSGLEDVRQTKIIQRIGSLVVAMSSTALGMDDSLWDSLPIEV